MTPAVAAARMAAGARRRSRPRLWRWRRGPRGSDAVAVARCQEPDRGLGGGSRPEEEEEHPAPVRRPWRHGGGGEKSHRCPHEGRRGRRPVVQRAMVDRRASKRHLTVEASLVLIQRRSGKAVPAASGGVHLKELEYTGEAGICQYGFVCA